MSNERSRPHELRLALRLLENAKLPSMTRAEAESVCEVLKLAEETIELLESGELVIKEVDECN